MSVAQGPPIAVKPIPLHERLRRYSLPDVERTLQMLIANGNLADYDDELANRVQDAIDLCVAVRELLPTLAAPVPAREWWRHVKTGGVYEVIVPTALREWDHCACVVYRGEDGRTWVRPCGEFHDGRFERIPPPAADK